MRKTTNNKLTLCITMDKEYILAAIDLNSGVFTTAEDAACFQPALLKLTKDVARTGGVEILHYSDITAVILPHYGITDTVKIDISMEQFLVSEAGFICSEILKAFEEADAAISEGNLLTGIKRLDAEIYRKSAYWKKNGEPEYPFQATRDRQISIDDGLKLKDNYIVAIPTELLNITKPDMPIMLTTPQVSDLVRAFSDGFCSGDYLLEANSEELTSEFMTPEELEEVYRLSPSALYPDLEALINFNYFAKELTPTPDLLNITITAIKSIHYRHNLKTIRANLGINGENLELLVGHSAVSETLNPNEIKLFKILENLLIGCLMYEYDFLSVEELHLQGEIRSSIFDQYMLGFIRRVLSENYIYTGKAFSNSEEMISGSDEEDEDNIEREASLNLVGYDKIVQVNGVFAIQSLTQEDIITNREMLDLDGDRYIKDYLNDIASSRAYIEMFLYMLRFGATKNRYIKVHSEKEPKFPYFDTLTFKPIAVPTIDSLFKPVLSSSGKSYCLTGEIRLDRMFEAYNSVIGVPIGVVLTQTLSNGSHTKKMHYILDAVTFYNTFARLKEDKTPYFDIEGVNISGTSVVMDSPTLKSTLVDQYNASQICQLLNNDDEKVRYSVETIPQIRKAINDICKDAKVPTSYTLFDGYRMVEEGSIEYKDLLGKQFLDNFKSADLYACTRIASLQLPKLLEQSMGNSFIKTSVIDIMEGVLETLKISKDKLSTDNLFDKLLQGTITQYCQIMNNRGEEIGYAFFCKHKEADYLLITSRREIGLRIPIVQKWKVMHITHPALQPILLQYNAAENKEAFYQKLITKRYVFDSIDTFRYLQEDAEQHG